ncbi:MAG: 2-oxo-4-hydroxy-4-carboxy-5-ureidoimidazoline decarboxylase [Acidobacteria bacterium]|nr:2-oxo-4-hydroxy-4-carboxy-5-ureidoimidazoline decarboxylase [Acidobacteriota bacterium]MCA1642032.1 2-oxo-4-hydroxy-4-carboxy-5-ureidoimidazoline decarboxylase [Acidobacteriota bacterium]
MEKGIGRLNDLTHDEAEAAFLQCCGSTAWACGMSARRPFVGADEMLRAAEEAWEGLDEEDWLEAFSRHPRIGEARAATGQTGTEKEWSAREQSGMDAAGDAARRELDELNRAYAEKFGYIFIVCATGKSPEEMLADLRERLRNDPATEIARAAEEQRRITKLRLEKLLEA